MQAMCGRRHEIFSYTSTAGTLQEASDVGQDGFVSIYVPEGYRYGYRFGTGEAMEKRNSFTITANINELIVFQDIARYRFW